MNHDPTTNANLYARGRACSKRSSRRTEGGLDSKAALRRIAADMGLDVPDARAAIRFADAVDAIARNAGPDAMRAILAGHRHLTTKRVMQIGRTHPERQRFAMAQVAAGRHPSAKPSDGSAPPFDTLGFGEVEDRLTRFAGLLDRVANGLRDTPREVWPPEAKLAAMGGHLEAIRLGCSTLRAELSGSGCRDVLAPAPEGPPADRRRPRAAKARVPFVPNRVLAPVANVRGVMDKNLRDMPRLLREGPPSDRDRAPLLAGLGRMDSSASGLMEVIRKLDPAGPNQATSEPPGPVEVAAEAGGTGRLPRVVPTPDGPEARPGTYIVIYRLDADLTGLRVGALGTFDLPAGYYAYVGSAFGAGGVQARVGRHLTPVKVKPKWNVDHLTPHTRAVEAWWTHDPIKRECTWSRVLAGSPEYDCPASEFGSRDCRSCPAHLYHSLHRPSIRDFVRRLRLVTQDHGPVFQHRVADTSPIASS